MMLGTVRWCMLWHRIQNQRYPKADPDVEQDFPHPLQLCIFTDACDDTAFWVRIWNMPYHDNVCRYIRRQFRPTSQPPAFSSPIVQRSAPKSERSSTTTTETQTQNTYSVTWKYLLRIWLVNNLLALQDQRFGRLNHYQITPNPLWHREGLSERPRYRTRIIIQISPHLI